MPAPTPTTSRVLIADESVASRGVLVILLESAGYDVITVNDGHHAMQALRAHAFDLAVLDHEMPTLDDLGAIAELRQTSPALPVIVCAGAFTPDLADRYRALGIHELLPKPVDPHALCSKIIQLLSPQRPQPVAGLSSAPFRDLHATAETPVPSPLASGLSRLSRQLKTELARLREFRSVAILEGRLGSGRFELALGLAPAVNAHKCVCHADTLDAEHLDLLFKPIAADTLPVFLVVLEAQLIDAAHQTFLADLVSGRLPNYPTITKRLRLVLCSQTSLCDLHFNEMLLMRAVTSTLQIPEFKDRWMDWAEIARAILRRVGAGRGTFDPEAIAWINRQTWPGDYMQLHRTIELARRHAGVASVLTDAHLAAAFAAEPACEEPLFHDLLFHVHSTAEA